MKLKKIENYFIGDLLSKTEDVFDKAKITFLFYFILFIFIIAIPFVIQLYLQNYIYHLIINLFEIIVLISIFILFKKNATSKQIGLTFFGMDIIMSTVSLIFQNANFDLQAGVWSILLILFCFFVLGNVWGLLSSLFIFVLFIACQPINGIPALLNFNVPDNQVVPSEEVFITFPFLLIIYLVYYFIKTKLIAEKLIKKQQIEILEQKKDINDSILYAKKIQDAISPHDWIFNKFFPESFVLYLPKDIVSGDFYWFHQIDEEESIIAVGDCTGHGIPGAFMTVIGSNLLNEIIIREKNYSLPDVLQQLDERVSYTLKQDISHDKIVQDGMDILLLKVNKKKNIIEVSSANRPFILIQNNTLQIEKGTKFSIGGFNTTQKKFDLFTTNINKNDSIYLFSDGYVDQFGGEKNKRFKTESLKQLINENHDKPLNEQLNIFKQTINNWKRNNEQTDDIIVLGIKF
ncbi:MAG: SpoIIE family protein phosphatase [Flavobacteriia bacterium]|nr:SpoIIE family protein phosphatase [Flavobacteriia bacterium]